LFISLNIYCLDFQQEFVHKTSSYMTKCVHWIFRYCSIMQLFTIIVLCAVVNELVYFLGIDVNISFNTGWTPILYAAQNASPESIDYLLRHGADPNMCKGQRHFVWLCRMPLFGKVNTKLFYCFVLRVSHHGVAINLLMQSEHYQLLVLQSDLMCFILVTLHYFLC